MGMLSARLGTLAIACALTLGAATGTLGCKKLLTGLKGYKGADAGNGKTTTTSANTPQDDVDEQMLDKLDAYIICLNTLSNPVHQTRARYFSWVDPKKGVTGNEKVVLGLFDIPSDTVKKCTDGLTKARTMPPRDSKLEAAGDASPASPRTSA